MGEGGMRFDIDPHRGDCQATLSLFTWGRDLHDSRRPFYWMLALGPYWKLTWAMSGRDNEHFQRLSLTRRGKPIGGSYEVVKSSPQILTVRDMVKGMGFWGRLDFAVRMFWAILLKTL